MTRCSFNMIVTDVEGEVKLRLRGGGRFGGNFRSCGRTLGWFYFQKFYFKYQRGVGRNWACAFFPICKVWGNNKLSFSSHLHTPHSLIKSHNYLICSNNYG